MNKLKWEDTSLEYRQGYFWGLITIISFCLGITIGIPIEPMQKWLTLIPTLMAIIMFGILAIKIIPYIYDKFVLLNWKYYKQNKKRKRGGQQ